MRPRAQEPKIAAPSTPGVSILSALYGRNRPILNALYARRDALDRCVPWLRSARGPFRSRGFDVGDCPSNGCHQRPGRSWRDRALRAAQAGLTDDAEVRESPAVGTPATTEPTDELELA